MTTPAPTPCGCYACDGSPAIRSRYYLCATCGNKRCPHATDHRLPCTGSNEPDQPGSFYSDVSVTDALAARVTELEAALKEALDEIDDVLGYVGRYHVEKWGYRETVARLRKVQGVEPSAEPAQIVKGEEAKR